MPERAGLFRQRGDQRGVRVAQRIDRDPAAEIQISLAALGDQPAAFAPDKGQGRAVVGGQTDGIMRGSPATSGPRPDACQRAPPLSTSCPPAGA